MICLIFSEFIGLSFFMMIVTCYELYQAQMQESARKDVERAFGVLQSRWGIVWNPALTWDEGNLWKVMTACVIMHNMIVEDERDDSIFDQGFDFQGENVEPLHQESATFE